MRLSTVPDSPDAQEIFEQFLLGRLSRDDAVGALLPHVRARKASGEGPLLFVVKKPEGVPVVPLDIERAKDFSAELQRRATGDAA